MNKNNKKTNLIDLIKPIKAKPHTAPYKIHKYFARRPWNVFEGIIKAVTEKGELILDPFCGGGVTIYESLKNNRNVIGIDLNPLSIFIIKNMIKTPENYEELIKAIESCKNYLLSLYQGYSMFTKDKKIYDLTWAELTYIVECNYCKTKNLIINENKISNGKYQCSNRKCQSNRFDTPNGFYTKDCKRFGYKYIYLINKSSKIKTIKKFKSDDKFLLEKQLFFLKKEIRNNNIKLKKTKIPDLWDRQFEDQLQKKGIEFFEDFFTERNYYINVLLKWKVNSLKKALSVYNYELLRVILSNILKESNIMSFTNDTWQGGNPTTWSKHAYWIPSQFCEVNIYDIFDKAAQRIINCLKYNEREIKNKPAISFSVDSIPKSNVVLINSTLDSLQIPSNSIDAIVTDPPYGSNVQYLELSHFWYPWNKDLYKNEPIFDKEAISNRKKFPGSKSMIDYEKNLFSVFKESYRVLKPHKYLILTFNNKNISAWLALLVSVFKSGFTFEKNGLVFQDGVSNYKQTAHTKFDGSPYGDFIYVFKKIKKKNYSNVNNNIDDFILQLDQVFLSHISNYDSVDKNKIKKEMFLEAIPIIEKYIKCHPLEGGSDKLYNHFTKNYFNKLYK